MGDRALSKPPVSIFCVSVLANKRCWNGYLVDCRKIFFFTLSNWQNYKSDISKFNISSGEGSGFYYHRNSSINVENGSQHTFKVYMQAFGVSILTYKEDHWFWRPWKNRFECLRWFINDVKLTIISESGCKHFNIFHHDLAKSVCLNILGFITKAVSNQTVSFRQLKRENRFWWPWKEPLCKFEMAVNWVVFFLMPSTCTLFSDLSKTDISSGETFQHL